MSTASCILANIAMQLGRTLTWDPNGILIDKASKANTTDTQTAVFSAP